MPITIPNYTFIEELYEGRHSYVYRCKRDVDNVPVIIKISKDERPDARHVAQLQHEYAFLQKFNSEHVIKAYALEPLKERVMLILEDCDAQPLADLIKIGKINLDTFFKISIGLAEGIGEVHHQSIIHKDIKPHNIIVNMAKKEVKIIDFGISTLLSREVQQAISPSLIQGTVAYISPEQTGRMNRSIDYSTDIYSIGVTMYEMLLGRVPFDSQDLMELIHYHIAKVPEPPHKIDPTIPRAVSAIVMKCLAKGAENRYHSAYGLKNDLEKCQLQYTSQGGVEYFEPGQNDVFDQFALPQKLYGRESEVETLLETFERSSRGSVEVLLVKGPEGIGKSRLVNEIQQSVMLKKGFFISGRFEQIKTNTPYSALIQAFQSLILQLLAESAEELDEYRKRLLKALGNNGQMIIDIIPEVELIIGTQPPMVNQEFSQAENKFNFVFASFIEAFLRKKRPLVVFLDDMQWSDPASLKILLKIAGDLNQRHLLFIMAYRDNEVTASHPFSLTIHDIQQAGGLVETITLKPLEETFVLELVSQTFHNTEEQTKALTHAVYHKTGGSPFFVVQFLKMLYKESLINFDMQKQCWIWDIERIQALHVTENVATLISSKIQKMSPLTQILLKTAAAIGHTFDLQTLANVCEMTPSQTAEALWEGQVEEMIIAEQDAFLLGDNTGKPSDSSHITYAFQHDRIQQAAYQLTPQEELNVLHLHIGREMQALAPKENENIMTIVNQLNFGIDLIEESDEREALAQFNLKAGKKASGLEAYTASQAYFQTGIKLLTTNAWHSQYELTYALYKNNALCNLQLANHAEVEKGLDLLLREVKSTIEKGRIYYFKISYFNQLGKFLDAIRVSTEALAFFGINARHPPDHYEVISEKLKLHLHLWQYNEKSLCHLPVTQDEFAIVIGEIYNAFICAGYYTAHRTYRYLVISLINLCIKNGIEAYSSLAFICYAKILVSQIHQDYKQGIKFANVGLKLIEKFPLSILSLQSEVTFYCLVGYWTMHIKTPIPLLKVMERKCFAAGLMVFTSSCFITMGIFTLASDKNLVEVESDLRENQQMAALNKMPLGVLFSSFMLSVCASLRGMTEGISDLRTDEWKDLLSQPKPVGVAFALQFHNCVWRSMLYYYHEKYAEAVALQEKLEPYYSGYLGHFLWTYYYFFQAMSLVALCVTPEGKRRYWTKVQSLKARIKKWADICPVNYLHKYLLLSGEMARVCGKRAEAMKIYERAIKTAHENDYLNDEALGYELAAKCCLESGDKRTAASFMVDAYNSYFRWGAEAKLILLREKYKDLLHDKVVSRSLAHQVASSQTFNETFSQTQTSEASRLTIQSSSSEFDVSTIIQASQTISGEIVLDKLLAKLMKITIVTPAPIGRCLS